MRCLLATSRKGRNKQLDHGPLLLWKISAQGSEGDMTIAGGQEEDVKILRGPFAPPFLSLCLKQKENSLVCSLVFLQCFLLVSLVFLLVFPWYLRDVQVILALSFFVTFNGTVCFAMWLPNTATG